MKAWVFLNYWGGRATGLPLPKVYAYDNKYNEWATMKAVITLCSLYRRGNRLTLS